MESHKNKLLVIVGLTATGKTSLALKLAKDFNGEIISADSRQVYTGLDIGTGKDIPKGARWHLSEFPMTNDQLPIGFWESKNRTRLWGYDLVEPTREFSVTHYIRFAEIVIKDILRRGKLPILAGGTGLYVKGVIDGIPSAGVPKNSSLRKQYRDKSVAELREILRVLDPFKLAAMNQSDRSNPRRLIRAIEVTKWKLVERSRKSGNAPKSIRSKNQDVSLQNPTSHFSHHTSCLFIGLKAPGEYINKRIKERVDKRLKQGIEDEIKNLLAKGVKWEMQSMNTLGYKEFRDYFEGKIGKEEAIDKWLTDEKNYAKRQLTWFKKDKRIIWFDISDKNWEMDIENEVKRWHNVRRR